MSMFAMIKEIKTRHFEVNISLDSRFRPLLLSILAGIPIRVAGIGMDDSDKKWYRYLYTHKYSITQLSSPGYN